MLSILSLVLCLTVVSVVIENAVGFRVQRRTSTVLRSAVSTRFHSSSSVLGDSASKYRGADIRNQSPLFAFAARLARVPKPVEKRNVFSTLCLASFGWLLTVCKSIWAKFFKRTKTTNTLETFSSERFAVSEDVDDADQEVAPNFLSNTSPLVNVQQNALIEDIPIVVSIDALSVEQVAMEMQTILECEDTRIEPALAQQLGIIHEENTQTMPASVSAMEDEAIMSSLVLEPSATVPIIANGVADAVPCDANVDSGADSDMAESSDHSHSSLIFEVTSESMASEANDADTPFVFPTNLFASAPTLSPLAAAASLDTAEGKGESEDGSQKSLSSVSMAPAPSFGQLRSLGVSGIIAYVLSEVGFWALYPAVIAFYQQAAGADAVDLTALLQFVHQVPEAGQGSGAVDPEAAVSSALLIT